MISKYFTCVVGFLGCISLLISCSGKQSFSSADQEDPGFAVNCIAVLPATTFVEFDKAVPAAQQQQLNDGIPVFDRVLQQQLISRADVRLVSDGQIAGMDTNLPAQPLERAQVIAERLSCNAVLETTLRRYKDRVGSLYSAQDPASVAFDYRLFSMPDGTVLCRGSFDETQQSVMENLLSFNAARERGFSWITSEQLLKEGVRDRFEDCRYLRANR